MLRDLRHAFRSLRLQPGFALVAIAVLAIGIGANTAIFSVVESVLLRPLSFRDPERLVMLWEKIPNFNQSNIPVPVSHYLDFRSRTHSFEDVAAFDHLNFNLSGPQTPKRIFASRVSPNMFPMLGVRPLKGRLFTTEEEQPGKQDRVILSYALWKELGASDQVIGSTVRLDNQPFTVIGVLPREIGFPPQRPVEAFVPLAISPKDLENRFDNFDTRLIARLKSGASLEQAREDANAVALYQESLLPPRVRSSFSIRGNATWLREEVIGDVRTPLLVLFTAVGFVLLIACSNVANLLLVRAASRRRELAIRAALGANRSSLVRLVLAEGLILATVGGLIGLGLASWSADFLIKHSPVDLPLLESYSPDWRMLAFAAALSIATGILFAVAPAWRASAAAPVESMREGSRGSQSWKRNRLRQGLVIAEVSLSVVLLAGAGLLIKSFWNLMQVDPGFRPDRTLTFAVSLPRTGYPEAKDFQRFHGLLAERLKALPGVEVAGGGSGLPLEQGWTIMFTPDNQTSNQWANTTARQFAVLPGYHEALTIPLKQGRLLQSSDGAEAAAVVLVNETLAKRFWPGENVIGRKLKWGSPQGEAPWMTIVGVVADTKQDGMEKEVMPATYMPAMQLSGPALSYIAMNYTLRTAVDPLSLMPAVRAEVQRLDPEVPVFAVHTMDENLEKAVAPRRFQTMMFTLFAAVAVLLAITGLYGVLAYSVAQSTREIGIRIALGARVGQVLTDVIGHGMRLVAVGLAIGIAGALALTRYMRSLLYGVEFWDPYVITGVSLLLAIVAVVACLIPARRAAHVDPIVALRCE
jgi:predicted permease